MYKRQVTITAEGTNPAYNVSAEANDIDVQPGNGTPVTTASIVFGNSVSNVSVVPSNPIAGASTNYTIGFRAADSVSAGGDIDLSEAAGPTIDVYKRQDGTCSSPELVSPAVRLRLETLRLQSRHDFVAMVGVARFQREDNFDFAHPYRGPGTPVLDLSLIHI